MGKRQTEEADRRIRKGMNCEKVECHKINTLEAEEGLDGEQSRRSPRGNLGF